MCLAQVARHVRLRPRAHGQVRARPRPLTLRPVPAGGHVTFAGAGPDDSGCLTLNAACAVHATDVILFDDLASDEVPDLARREVRRIRAGKHASRPSCRQDEITFGSGAITAVGDPPRGRRPDPAEPLVIGRVFAHPGGEQQGDPRSTSSMADAARA